MVDFIIVAVLVVIIGAAAAYLVKAKKSGAKCIGCPAGGECPHSKTSECSCGCGGSGDDTNAGSCGCHADTKE